MALGVKDIVIHKGMISKPGVTIMQTIQELGYESGVKLKVTQKKCTVKKIIFCIVHGSLLLEFVYYFQTRSTVISVPFVMSTVLIMIRILFSTRCF
jgi:hypothetical protein